jgi:cystathionine gamma-synthase
MKLETIAVHVGRELETHTRAVTPSITLATTFERNADGTMTPDQHIYTRASNPNRVALERTIATLEGGATCCAFSSGMAAASAILQILKTGDHVIMPDDQYHGVRHVAHEFFAEWGLQVTWVDQSDIRNVENAISPNTKLIWCETPSNPLLKIVDLHAVAALAKKANIMCACDNTWATPIFQRPLEIGFDISWHSTTKYFGGHSDVLGGAVVWREDSDAAKRMRSWQTLGGAVPSPFDCWLLQRSIPTMPYRMRAQTANAQRVAEFLEQHPRVQRVSYPGLPSHPSHAIAKRQMSQLGAMLSFEVRGDEAMTLAVTSRVRVFTRATSLGGVESLLEHRASIEGADTKTPRNLIRVSVGLEHVDDLIEDLDQALD